MSISEREPAVEAVGGSKRPDPAEEVERLRARVHELEQVCADTYRAGVDLGLPHRLLARLWAALARGERPQDAGAPAPAREEAPPAAGPVEDPVDRWLKTAPTTAAAPAGTGEEQVALLPLAGRRRVLVVDDDRMMLGVLTRILERENYELLAATSGPEALGLLDRDGQPIDLLVTDFSMPGMRGRELADRVRQRWPHVKVLYQTGFSDMLFESRAELEEGAAFLEKPFTARGLREAARLVLFGALNP